MVVLLGRKLVAEFVALLSSLVRFGRLVAKFVALLSSGLVRGLVSSRILPSCSALKFGALCGLRILADEYAAEKKTSLWGSFDAESSVSKGKLRR